MKRMLSLLLMFFLFLTTVSCSQETKFKTPVRYYYTASEFAYGQRSGILVYETREGHGKLDKLQLLVQDYLAGPSGKTCVSPFPTGTEIVSLSSTEKRISLVLSSEMANISGLEITICCACLSKTLLEAVDVSSIEISIADNLINGENSLIFTNSSFQFWDFASEYPENN